MVCAPTNVTIPALRSQHDPNAPAYMIVTEPAVMSPDVRTFQPLHPVHAKLPPTKIGVHPAGAVTTVVEQPENSTARSPASVPAGNVTVTPQGPPGGTPNATVAILDPRMMLTR